MIPEPCRRRKKKEKIKQIKKTNLQQGRKRFLHWLHLRGEMALRSIRELLLTECRASENHFSLLQLVLVEWRFIRISYRVNREGLMPTGKIKKSFWSVQLPSDAKNQPLLTKMGWSLSQMLVGFFFPDMFSQIQKQEKMDVQRGLVLGNYKMKTCFSKTPTTSTDF